MLLREIFYFDKETVDPVEDDRYDPTADHSPIDYDDTRKTRLSLKHINKARKAGEFHKDEQQKELQFVRQMYGAANQPEM